MQTSGIPKQSLGESWKPRREKNWTKEGLLLQTICCACVLYKILIREHRFFALFAAVKLDSWAIIISNWNKNRESYLVVYRRIFAWGRESNERYKKSNICSSTSNHGGKQILWSICRNAAVSYSGFWEYHFLNNRHKWETFSIVNQVSSTWVSFLHSLR